MPKINIFKLEATNSKKSTHSTENKSRRSMERARPNLKSKIRRRYQMLREKSQLISKEIVQVTYWEVERC